ncbi:MAG TPA: hypothetical protein VF041_01360 [Gemmatimonadaceae bacterium]
MSTSSVSYVEHGPTSMVRVLTAGVVVGVLDIVYAWLLWGVVLGQATAMRIPQSIAAGLLGRAAFQGGVATAALGLALHFTFAMAWAMLFYVLSERWPALRRLTATTRGAVTAGLLYGPVIWVVMNHVVIPLSRLKEAPWLTWLALVNVIQHMVMIGVPIALIERPRGGR